MTTHDDQFSVGFLADVAELLSRRGLSATVEYPGALAVRAGDLQLWTGLTGWDYGSVSRLVGDAWQPEEGIEAFIELPHDGVASAPLTADRVEAAARALYARHANKENGPKFNPLPYHARQMGRHREDI